MNWKDITLSPILPAWIILGLLGLGILALIFLYPGLQKRVGRGRGLCLSALRLGALVLLIGCFLDPASTERREKKSSPSLVFIVDTSATMALPGKGGKSRLDEAKALLLEGDKPLLKSLAGRLETQVYSLGESFRPLEAGEIAGLKAAGSRGDLDLAVEKLSSKNVLPLPTPPFHRPGRGPGRLPGPVDSRGESPGHRLPRQGSQSRGSGEEPRLPSVDSSRIPQGRTEAPHRPERPHPGRPRGNPPFLFFHP